MKTAIRKSIETTLTLIGLAENMNFVVVPKRVKESLQDALKALEDMTDEYT